MADVTLTVTGLSSTSSLGDLSYTGAASGYGRYTWGQAGWNDSTLIEQGWGRESWGYQSWGDTPIVTLPSLSASTSLGALIAEIKPGWGTLDWGENGWGTVESAVFNLTGLSATSSVGTLIAEDVVGLPALSVETDIGSLTAFSNHTLTLPSLSLVSSPGLLSVDDHSIGLSGQSATSAVGSISPADVMGITAPSAAQTDVGNITISSNPVIDVTGVSASTSLGSLTIDNITPALLAGQSASTSLGTLTTTQLSIASLVGLGQVATSSIGEVVVLGYQDIDIIGNTSYSAVNKTNGASYSDVDVVGNTSYTDVTRVVQEKKIMASTYTDLGLELMATGENAGTWGTKTNANLSLIEQLTGGYNSQAVTDSGTPTALTIADGALTGTAQQRVIELTGSISGSRVVTFPLLTENFYIIKNGTSGAYTVQLKAASGSGATVTFAADNKGYKLIYLDGVATNTGVFEAVFGDVTLTGTETLTNKTLTSPKIGTSILDTGGNELFKLTATGSAVNELTYANAATGNKPTFTASGGDTNIGVSIQPKGSGTVTIDALTFPAADGSADQILTTNGSGVLSFVDNSGGTSWQAVQTSTPFTAVAGNGYFINTTSGAIEMDLPAGSIGDEISFVDYAGTFDTNALTIDQNGTEKIMGSTSPLTVSVERAANTLVYTDSTQGWLLKNK